MTKPNGHDRSASRANGHALPVSSRELRGARLAPGRAASDERRDFPSVAGAQAPAGMERDLFAEVAPPGEALQMQRQGRAGKPSHREPRGSDSSDDSLHMVDIRRLDHIIVKAARLNAKPARPP